MARSSMSRSGSRGSSSRKPAPAAKLVLPFGLEEIAAAAFLFLAVLLGGASAGGFAANAVLQFLSALLIAWAIVTLDWGKDRRSERVPLLFALALVALMAIQLIPLPPALWTALPGRARVVEGLTVLGVNPLPWMPLSLNPSRTLWGITAMLPPIAAIVLVLRFSRTSAQFALWALFAGAVASVLMGLGQLSSGADSPFYLYTITNRGSAVGFFSNANHFATLMLIVLPLVAGVAVRTRVRRDEAGGASVIWIAAPAVALLALLGVLAAGSVAGLLLTPVALLAGFLIFRGTLSGRMQLGLLGGGALVVIAALTVVLLSPSTKDFGQTSFSGSGQSRSYIWGVMQKAVPANLPLGSGFGSFQPVFRQYEDPAKVGPGYVNHSHSDLLEMLLEGGALSGLLLLAFLAWYVWRSWRLWMKYGSRDSVGCAASVAVLLVMLHSLVDYPLRTSAIAVPFALCLALMARAPRAATQAIAAETPSARHLSV